MPTYDYACTECGHNFEAVQSFADDALTVCPQCGGRLRKVFNSVGIVFKGSGFYRNDSREKASSGAKKSDAKADLKPDAKPAATTDSGSSSSTAKKSGEASPKPSGGSSSGSTSGPSSTSGSAA